MAVFYVIKANTPPFGAPLEGYLLDECGGLWLLPSDCQKAGRTSTVIDKLRQFEGYREALQEFRCCVEEVTDEHGDVMRVDSADGIGPLHLILDAQTNAGAHRHPSLTIIAHSPYVSVVNMLTSDVQVTDEIVYGWQNIVVGVSLLCIKLAHARIFVDK